MATAFQPAWQTEDLKDEWPEEGDDVSEHYTRSISLTIPVGSLHNLVHSSTGLSQDTDSDVADVVGTFLIRQDTLATLPQRLTAQKKGLIKDFFSPIALERMFDPPSPRTSVFPSSNPSARNDHSRPLQLSTIQTSSITPIGDQEGFTNRRPTGTSWRPDMSCPFTFSVPHPAPLTHIASSSPTQDQNATRTAVAPLTDPPLRLFQFQYDTFTRDHLSAMVDSIAVNSPSGSNTGNLLASTSSPFGLPPVSEASAHSSPIELRSAKRVKLSPPSYPHSLKSRTSSGVGRPVRRKDYVGESRLFMAQIKSAKHSLSTPPSTASIHCPNPNDSLPCQSGVQDLCESRPPMSFILTDLWAVALSPSNVVDSLGGRKDSVVTGPASAFKMKGHSSLGYRQQAESLMAQLKQDMKGSKRIFSIDATDLSPDDASRSIQPIAIPSPPYRTLQNQRNLTPTIQRGDSRKIPPMVVLSST
jgi:hypothetical protein